MSMNDPVSDMIARIRNACMAKLKNLDVIYSKVNLGVLKVLTEEGYIESFDILEDGNKRSINVKLRYFQNMPSIQIIKRISRPGKRVYTTCNNLAGGFKNGLGTQIVSTSQGIMSDRHCIKSNLGGEVICKVF